MKRPIKFRAWHQEQKRMFNVYGIGPDFITEDTINGVDPGTNAFCDDDLNFIDLMQFTGLRDKNGVDIYEGDVVQFSSWKPKEIIYEGGNGFAGFRLKGTDAFLMGYDSERMEVIGNIHQTPELLKP